MLGKRELESLGWIHLGRRQSCESQFGDSGSKREKKERDWLQCVHSSLVSVSFGTVKQFGAKQSPARQLAPLGPSRLPKAQLASSAAGQLGQMGEGTHAHGHKSSSLDAERAIPHLAKKPIRNPLSLLATGNSQLTTRNSQLATLRVWPNWSSWPSGQLALWRASWPASLVASLAREGERECVRETSSGRQTLLGAKLRAAILLARFIECGPLIQLFPLVFLFVCPFGSGQSQMSLFVRVVRHPSGRATPTGCAKAAQAASKQCAQTVPEQHTNWPKMDGESICDRPPTAQCSAKSPASSSPVGQSAGV